MNVRVRLVLILLLGSLVVGCTEATPEGTFFGSLVAAPSLQNNMTSFKIRELPLWVKVPGTCSTLASKVEYSFDGVTWGEISGSDGDCSDGTFNMDIGFGAGGDVAMTGTNGETVILHLRSQGTLGTTSVTDVTVEYDSTYEGPSVNLLNIPSTLTNQPAYDVNVESTEAVMYQSAVVASGDDCSDATYSPDVDLSLNVASSLVSDGIYKLCVRGVDIVGQAASPSKISEYSWTLDTEAPTVYFSSGQPLSLTNLTTANVGVSSGDGADRYRYKVGLSGSTDCTEASGYGGEATLGNPIGVNVVTLGGDGEYKLCVLGGDAAGNWQAEAAATSFTWTVDTVAPTAVLSGVPTGPTSDSSLSVTVGGTDVFSYKSKFGLKASTDCSVAAGYSAEALVATSLTGVTAAPDTYKLCVIGKDTAGNWQSEAAATSYEWEYNPVDIQWTGLGGDEMWSTAANWSSGVAPGINDQVEIGSDCSACDVQLSGNVSVNKVTFSSGTLDLNGHNLSVTKDFTASASAKLYEGCDGTVVAGTIANSGTTYTGNHVLISAGDVNQSESNSFSVLVSVNRLNCETTSMNYTLMDGTAKVNDDYTSMMGSLNILAGNMSESLPLNVANDTLNEDDETFFLKLSNPLYGVEIVNDTGTITIENDDAEPTVSVMALSPTVVEGEDAMFEVTLSAPSGKTVTVDYETVAGTATSNMDYGSVTPTPIVFAPGEMIKPVTISTTDDGNFGEPDEDFFIQISTPVNAVVFTDTASTFIVRNDVYIDNVFASSSDPTQMQLNITYHGDANGDAATFNAYYCNETDHIGCDPDMGPYSITVSGGVGGTTLTDFYIPNDPDDTLKFKVISTDPDEIMGDPNSRMGSGSLASDSMIPTFAGLQDILVIDDTSVMLFWSAASDNYNYPEDIRYSVCYEASLSSCSSFSAVGEPGELNHIINGLTPGTAYSFAVRAEDSTGNIDVNSILLQRNKVQVNKTIAGGQHVCTIDQSDRLWCWGDNTYGQLGVGDIINRSQPVTVTSNVNYVAAGRSHTCAIDKMNYYLWCWGKNDRGQLGLGSTGVPEMYPVQVGTAKYTYVAARGDSTCAVGTDGKVYCWGAGDDYILGNGDSTDRSTPTQVGGAVLQTYTSVSVGDGHACAIGSDLLPLYTNRVACWGKGSDGRLGTGSTTDEPTPALTSDTDPYSYVSAGENSTCGITETGDELKCWGNDSNGQLGNGSPTGDVTSPQTIGSNYAYVQVGARYACAITAAGNLECWGQNFSGQLGINSTPTFIRTVPGLVSSINDIGYVALGGSGSNAFTCADTNGELFCWGDGSAGQLGIGPLNYSQRPVSVIVPAMGDPVVKKVVRGRAHACALMDDGKVKCWGRNNYGQLGVSSVNLYEGSPQIIIGLTAKDIAAGGDTTCAIDANTDQVLCWGRNDKGQIGDSTAVSKSTPTAAGSMKASQVVTSGQHTCAIQIGTSHVFCWGSQVDGALGNGQTSGQQTVPLDISFSAKTISAGGSSTCAIDMDDELWCWGNNAVGNLGDNTTTSKASPTAISSGETYQHVSVGQSHTCAVTTDNSVECWGLNNRGQVGDGTASNTYHVPQSIDLGSLSAGTQFAEVEVGSEASCARTTDHELACWGSNAKGALGLDLIPQANLIIKSPMPSTSFQDISQISMGLNGGCGVAGGKAYCWGVNSASIGVGPVDATSALGLGAGPIYSPIAPVNFGN